MPAYPRREIVADEQVADPERLLHALEFGFATLEHRDARRRLRNRSTILNNRLPKARSLG